MAPRGAMFRAEVKVQAALPVDDAPAVPRAILLGFLSVALDAVDSWAITKKRTVDTNALRGIVAALGASDA